MCIRDSCIIVYALYNQSTYCLINGMTLWLQTTNLAQLLFSWHLVLSHKQYMQYECKYFSVQSTQYIRSIQWYLVRLINVLCLCCNYNFINFVTFICHDGMCAGQLYNRNIAVHSSHSNILCDMATAQRNIYIYLALHGAKLTCVYVGKNVATQYCFRPLL